MPRIYLAGGPGSGKSTLARHIANQLTIPAYEMDLVGWENGVGAERPLDMRLRDVHEIAIQEDWVVEGGHHPWIDELMEQANLVVWLDMPWRIAGWRILTRHMRASLAGTNRHPGLLKLYHFMRYARHDYTSQQIRQQTLEELKPYMHKIVHCRRPADVEAFFTRLVKDESQNVEKELDQGA